MYWRNVLNDEPAPKAPKTKRGRRFLPDAIGKPLTYGFWFLLFAVVLAGLLAPLLTELHEGSDYTAHVPVKGSSESLLFCCLIWGATGAWLGWNRRYKGPSVSNRE